MTANQIDVRVAKNSDGSSAVVSGVAPRTIPLTHGRVALVDADVYALVSQFKWSVTGNGYVGMWGVGKLHRFVAGASDGDIVDHINGDKLDNRRANLRICTNTENVRSARKTTRPTSSRFKGVAWSKAGWVARCRGSFLGRYRSEIEAARAYDRAAREHFGAFAKTNVDLGLLPAEAA